MILPSTVPVNNLSAFDNNLESTFACITSIWITSIYGDGTPHPWACHLCATKKPPEHPRARNEYIDPAIWPCRVSQEGSWLIGSPERQLLLSISNSRWHDCLCVELAGSKRGSRRQPFIPRITEVSLSQSLAGLWPIRVSRRESLHNDTGISPGAFVYEHSHCKRCALHVMTQG